MAVVSISLFGRFCVRCGEQVLSGSMPPKAQELFSYLLLSRDRPLPRETLAGVLWGDSATTQAKKSLRQARWQLQVALNAEIGSAASRLLLVEPEWIQVNPEADLWLDVEVFERAFDRMQAVPVQELDALTVQCLQEAAQLYRGDLLEGWYQNWCLYERERLQNILLAILDKLMSYSEARHEYAAGQAYGGRILGYDRASERTHRVLMRLHYLKGDRTAALRQYERCAAALAETLGAKPGKRTVALYERIRSEQMGGATSATAADDAPQDTSEAPMEAVLSHLKQLQTSLSDLQRQVQQAIQDVRFDLMARR